LNGTRLKHAALMVGAAAGMASAQPGAAQVPEPIRVGVLDVAAKRIVGVRDGVSLEYREFTAAGRDPGRWKTPAGPDHGEMVVQTFLEQYRRLDRKRPVEIYAANAFSMKEKEDGTTALSMDFDQARQALSWMKSKGVRVVVTAFNTTSKARSDVLMDEAERLGMVVFAGGANTKDAGRVYPAADPRSVSVVDSGTEMALRRDASIASWIDFAMDGTVVTGSGADRAREVGSSYASAKAGAYGAYVVSRSPDASVAEVKKALHASARQVSYTVAGQTVEVREIGGHQGDAAILVQVAELGGQRPAAAPVRTAMQAMAMNAGSVGR
jgi:hypothetical protein